MYIYLYFFFSFYQTPVAMEVLYGYSWRACMVAVEGHRVAEEGPSALFIAYWAGATITQCLSTRGGFGSCPMGNNQGRQSSCNYHMTPPRLPVWHFHDYRGLAFMREKCEISTITNSKINIFALNTQFAQTLSFPTIESL